MVKILCVGVSATGNDVTVASGIHSMPSLFDYDIAIVNLSIFQARNMSEWNYLGATKSASSDYIEVIDRLEREAALLMEKGGLLVCIVTPRVGLHFIEHGNRSSYTRTVSNYDWLPFVKGTYAIKELIVRGNGTDVFEEEKSAFSQYLKMKEIEWGAYFDNIEKLKLNEYVFDKTKADSMSVTILGKNRAEKPVSFQCNIGKGKIVFLPMLNHEKIPEILIQCSTKALSKKKQRPAPEWITAYAVPGEGELQTSLNENEKKIQDLEIEKQKIIKEIEGKNYLKKLLYEQDDELEDAVKKAFEEIGFKISKKGDIDWIAEADGKTSILEVTGMDKPIPIDKLRQLLEYAQTEENTEHTHDSAILVGNHCMNDPPEKRKESFTEKAIKAANTNSICLLPTTELFQAVCGVREGKITQKEIRDKILSSNGVCKIL